MGMIKTKEVNLKQQIRGFLFEVSRFKFERTTRSSELFKKLATFQKNHLSETADICNKMLVNCFHSFPPVSHLSCLLDFCENGGISCAKVPMMSPFLYDSSKDFFAHSPVISPINKSNGFENENDCFKIDKESKRVSLRVLYDFVAEES